MQANFTAVMPYIFREEGGYVDNPADPGGVTNMGITIGTLSAWAGHRVTPLDVKNMSRDTAMQIYRKQFWNRIDGDNLPSGVDYAVFDFAVNSGPDHAIRMLQKILGISQDGVTGTRTIAAVSGRSPHAVINALCDARAVWVKGLAAAATFGKGWLARVERVRAHAMALAADPQSVAPPKPVMAEAAPDAGRPRAPIQAALLQPGAFGTLASIIACLIAIFLEDGLLKTGLAIVVMILSIAVYCYAVKRNAGSAGDAPS